MNRNWSFLVIATAFTIFAGLQWNDPDPWGWMVLYGSTALIAILSYFGMIPRLATLAALAVTVFQLAELSPGFMEWVNTGTPSLINEMSVDQPTVEIAREFFGLFINAIALLFLFIKGRILLRQNA